MTTSLKELIYTTQIYIREGSSERAADILFCHPMTVMKRVYKLERIYGELLERSSGGKKRIAQLNEKGKWLINTLGADVSDPEVF